MRHALLLPAALLALGLPLSAAEAISARGSVTIKPVVDAAAKAYQASHPGFALSVVGTGTVASYKAVIAGDAALGMVVREPKPEEKAACPDLALQPIGRDALVFIVNAANPVAGLTADQVRGLYTGAITDWKDLGGTGPVQPVSTSEAMSTTELFEQSLGLEHQADPADPKAFTFHQKGAGAGTAKASVGATVQAALGLVAGNPAAVGFTALGLAQGVVGRGGRIRIVAYQGTQPSVETVNSGAYPITRTLYLVTKGPPAGDLKGFIDWLGTADGQKIVADSGFVALR